MIEIKEVVICTEARIGTGKSHDPVRRETSIWSKDGELLFSFDPCSPIRGDNGNWVLQKGAKITKWEDEFPM